MIVNPILPIWFITMICLILVLIIVRSYLEKDIKVGTLVRRLVLVIFIFLINMRFMYSGGKALTMSNDIDVLFVIDTTISMNAEDYGGQETRINGVKKDALNIIESFAGSRFAIITFDNVSHVVLPFTTDSNVTATAIESIQVINSYYAKGSSIDVAIDAIEEMLVSANKNADRMQVVFYMSDGEQTSSNKIKSFGNLKEYVDDGLVLGYGTLSGGYMRNNNIYDDNKYILDRSNYDDFPYPNAVSKIDEDNLKKIANDLGIGYQYQEENSVIKNDFRFKGNIKDNMEFTMYEDLYWLFSIGFIIVFMFEFWFNFGDLYINNTVRRL